MKGSCPPSEHSSVDSSTYSRLRSEFPHLAGSRSRSTVKYAGAAYLVWLGIRVIRTRNAEATFTTFAPFLQSVVLGAYER